MNLAPTRYTFWKDYFRSFVRAADYVAVDPVWDTDGATGDFVFPPTDGVIRWRLPSCVEVIPGKEAGEIDVDVAWLDAEPIDIYDTDGVATACDIATPDGNIVIADHQDQVVAAHTFGLATRWRAFVEVIDRDLSGAPGVTRGEKTTERHLIVVWPADSASPRWSSNRRDERARQEIVSYLSSDIDPAVGQREPSKAEAALPAVGRHPSEPGCP